MSELIALGPSDAEARWIGIRRHQALLAMAGLGLVGVGILDHHVSYVEIVLGIVLLALVVPMSGGPTLGEIAATALRYLARSRWNYFSLREFDDDVLLFAPHDVAFRAYELDHRGRLDLSGRDIALAESLMGVVDAASASSEDQHVSQHVMRRGAWATTMLTLPVSTPPPDGWRLRNSLAARSVHLGDGVTIESYERFTYLRTDAELMRVFRVKDFAAVPDSKSTLEQVLRTSGHVDVAVHVDVVAGAKAQRMAARAVHQMRSDDVTTSAAGFRRAARTSRRFERLAQREVLVANGRALVRLGVFIVVSASSLEQLQRDCAVLWRRAHDGGLRLERGWGHQLEWFRAQLPGGPGW
ncbi:MAG TPA: hypothetical protein VK704_01675 [Acidimicrobiales bacterium]|jgi:hypothetical protein|nr:hypothetical protein [Acidimicrobiales bacterium]